ncbi:3-oxoacyl-(acyl-carrier protein) reductase-like protein [Leptomonas seymouri]|uniref:3-oxoacyl-(Acyl-carrier protein) reductase-like protein n=1 Tax=Leptomonas seymouri TaxID=5684 RepID=A0A0N0P8F5_LEPSE|nr:3-oxoacyl-(acyl-carrier protein) reductase-like protein [Leptomonas seymouri]|eukprot:KPI89886.1 3-oxoacyl-(acyl-carrier protein) reductase-like protein [Leptomonas seymouri]
MRADSTNCSLTSNSYASLRLSQDPRPTHRQWKQAHYTAEQSGVAEAGRAAEAMVWHVEGKVGVITGASCALGREIAQRLTAQHRMKMACVSRKAFTTPLPVGCTPFKADISRSDDCDALLRNVKMELGPVSLLINCAGVTQNKIYLRSTDADYDAIMDTNLRGALQVTRAALRHGGLLQTQDGSVLHIGSIAGVVGNEGQVLYSASKAALTGATKSWAREYGARNIRFNVVAPGLIEGNGMATSLTEEQRQRWRDACPLKRLATVTEVADIVLAVVLCPYISSQTISVDGGLS